MPMTEFDLKERATMLAALNLFGAIWIEDGDQHYNREDLVGMVRSESGRVEPLTPSQVSALRDRIGHVSE